MTDYKTIAESKNFIVLDQYTPDYQVSEGYQFEDALEREFIANLQNQGYEFVADLNIPDKMLSNVRQQLQTLNNVVFSDGEWQRFVETYLDKPGDNIIDKTRKIHDDYIFDFVFDAPTLNTLFVDKNLRYHGLMQAYSRTNRIYDATKIFGNIVTFRDLEQATVDAITLFGDKNTKKRSAGKKLQGIHGRLYRFGHRRSQAGFYGSGAGVGAMLPGPCRH